MLSCKNITFFISLPLNLEINLRFFLQCLKKCIILRTDCIFTSENYKIFWSILVTWKISKKFLSGQVNKTL